jgi:hypothetical protein
MQLLKMALLGISLAFALLVGVIVAHLLPDSPPIPDAVQFYKDNEGFFDLLLDIQSRLKAGVESSYLSPRFSMDLHYAYSVVDDTKTDKLEYPYWEVEHGLIFPDEVRLIEETLNKIDVESASIYMENGQIRVGYMSYYRVELLIMYDVLHGEPGRPQVEDTGVINDDWFISLYGPLGYFRVTPLTRIRAVHHLR